VLEEEVPMKRILLVVPIVVGAAFAAKRMAGACGHIDFGARIAAMPDDAPPKWVFNNVSAIRANTERILELLQRQAPGGPAERAPASTGGTDG
jgi:hypothetical protein